MNIFYFKGSDNRIYKLKTYLLNYILDDREFIELYAKYSNLFSKPPNIEEEYIKKENIKLQENYIKQYEANSYKSKNKSFKIDFSQIELEQFDYFIFILNGCFKIMPYFDLDKYKNKVIFWEVHIDEAKGLNKFSDLEKLKNKSVLVIDSIYSGKTMLYIKKILKNVTDKINLYMSLKCPFLVVLKI